MNVGPERRESPLVRSYVHTRGRARPEHPVDVATLVRAVATGGTPELDPDRRRLVRIDRKSVV